MSEQNNNPTTTVKPVATTPAATTATPAPKPTTPTTTAAPVAKEAASTTQVVQPVATTKPEEKTTATEVKPAATTTAQQTTTAQTSVAPVTKVTPVTQEKKEEPAAAQPAPAPTTAPAPQPVKTAGVTPVTAQAAQPEKKEETTDTVPEALLVGAVAPTVQKIEVHEELDTRAEEEQAKKNAETNNIASNLATGATKQKEAKIKNPNAFNSEEKVLYKIKPEKESNPIVVVLVLLILGVFIVFLPNISNYIYNLLNPALNFRQAPPPAEEENDTLSSEIKDFESGNLTIELNDLEFTNFVKTSTEDIYDVTFTMINKADEPYLFEDHLYISFYNEKESLLYQGLIFTYQVLGSNGSTELSVVTNKNVYENGRYFKIEQIKPNDYPTARIDQKEEEFKKLSCSYNNDTIVYYFKDDLLNKISEKYVENKDSGYNFEGRKQAKYDEYLKLKTLKGVTTDFIETPLDFSVVTNINLGETEFQELQEVKIYKYFKNNANPNTVAFEIQALGYTCS